MIEIEVSPVIASWLGFRQFSESSVEPGQLQLLGNARALALQRPELARQLVQKLEAALAS